eukprot:SAG22_NODE_6800_length_809_cov_8.611268_1_plen_89_part_00
MPNPRKRSVSVPPASMPSADDDDYEPVPDHEANKRSGAPPTALKTIPSRSPSPAGRKLFVYAIRAPGKVAGKIFKDWPSASDALFRIV